MHNGALYVVNIDTFNSKLQLTEEMQSYGSWEKLLKDMEETFESFMSRQK